MNYDVPTPEVRQAERRIAIKNLARELGERARLNLRTAWELGKLLTEEKTELGEHGNWMEHCSKLGVKKDTVSRAMRLAQISQSEICSFDSITAALESLDEQERADIADVLPGEPPPQPKRAAPVETIFCKRCQRNGASRDCPQCKQAREHAARGDSKSGGQSRGKGNRAQRRLMLRTKEGAFDWPAWESHFGFVRNGPPILAEVFEHPLDRRIEAMIARIDQVYLEFEKLRREFERSHRNGH